MARFEDFKNATESLKNVFILLFYMMITFLGIVYGIPFIKQQIIDKMDKMHLTEMNIAGFKLLVDKELNSGSRLTSTKPKDVKVDSAAFTLANLVDKDLPSKETEYWVYIGQYTTDDNWTTKNFDISDEKMIKAQGSVFKRDAAPIQLADGGWILGKIIGLVNKGETVSVKDKKTIQGNNVWAKGVDKSN